MLDPSGEVEGERRRDVAFHVHVAGQRVAAGLGLVRRLEAVEQLRARRGRLARARSVEDRHAAVGVRLRLALGDAVRVEPGLGAEGEIHRRREADRQRAGEVEVRRELARAKLAGIEVQRARDTIGGIVGVADVEPEAVVAVGGTQVVPPAAHRALAPDRRAVVDHGPVDARQEAGRIQRAHHDRLAGPPIESPRAPEAVRGATERVQIDTARGRRPGVVERADVMQPGVAVPGPIADAREHVGGDALPADSHRKAGRDAVVLRLREVLHPGVRLRPIGARPIAILAAQGDESPFTQRAAPARVDLRDLPIVPRRLTEGARNAERGVLLQDHVDHARDRVRAVLRRGTVAQHFDALDRRGGNRIEVHARGPAPDRVVHGDHRAGMPPLPVQEHERLIGPQPAQREGPLHVHPASDGRAGEVQRWHEHLQDLRDLGSARDLHLLAPHHVDRHGRLGDGALGRPASAGDGDRLERKARPGKGEVVGHRLIGVDGHDRVRRHVADEPRGEVHAPWLRQEAIGAVGAGLGAALRAGDVDGDALHGPTRPRLHDAAADRAGALRAGGNRTHRDRDREQQEGPQRGTEVRKRSDDHCRSR